MPKDIEERLEALEAKVCAQEAEIDGLVRTCSDLLAAHAVLHKDVRLFSFLKEGKHSDRQKWKQDGTSRITASFFENRCNLFARLLDEAAHSQVFERYWHRSFFWAREEKQRNALERVRKAIQRYSDD